MCSIPLCIRFDKIDGFINIYDRIRYLVILDHNCFDKIYDSIKYFVSKKMVLQVIIRNFERIRIDTCNYLPIAKY